MAKHSARTPRNTKNEGSAPQGDKNSEEKLPLRHDLKAAPVVAWRVALERFVADLREAYGSRLDRVVLYGSRARGDADEDSDVDALVVLDDCVDFWAEHRRIGDLAIQASEGAETIVSAMPIGRQDFEQRRSPLLLNIRREGVRIG